MRISYWGRIGAAAQARGPHLPTNSLPLLPTKGNKETPQPDSSDHSHTRQKARYVLWSPDCSGVGSSFFLIQRPHHDTCWLGTLPPTDLRTQPLNQGSCIPENLEE